MAMFAVPIRTAKTSGAILWSGQHDSVRSVTLLDTYHGSGGPETTKAEPRRPIGNRGARNSSHQSLLSGVSLASPFFRILLWCRMTGKKEKYATQYPMSKAIMAKLNCTALKPHCPKTIPYDSRKEKINASLKPLRSDRKSTMGSKRSTAFR
jgi:hypothetical protein